LKQLHLHISNPTYKAVIWCLAQSTSKSPSSLITTLHMSSTLFKLTIFVSDLHYPPVQFITLKTSLINSLPVIPSHHSTGCWSPWPKLSTLQHWNLNSTTFTVNMFIISTWQSRKETPIYKKDPTSPNSLHTVLVKIYTKQGEKIWLKLLKTLLVPSLW